MYFWTQRLEESSCSVEELRAELGELEPSLKRTHEMALSLTADLGNQRESVSMLREELAMHQERVKVRELFPVSHCSVNDICSSPINMFFFKSQTVDRLYFSELLF